MGFVLSIFYLVVAYLGTATVFGPLAPYHIELILAALVFFVSLPALQGSLIFKTSQSFALIGLTIAVFLSVLIGVHWAGGAVQAFLAFIPCAFAYFLVCMHCNSRRKFQVLVLMLLLVCFFVTARGAFDLFHNVPVTGPPKTLDSGGSDLDAWNMEHPYLIPQRSDAGEWIYRVRGQNFINDPNDFGQLVVCVIPLMFIFWRSKRMLQNIAFVLLPVGALLFGTFLTHSRGALVALMAMSVVAARRRIGTLPALLVAAGLFVAAMALQFTGGRDVSAEAGSDRTALWGETLQLLKSHPVFGVGAGSLPDQLGHTAHNSILVCAGELGLFGLYFWALFLLPTVRDALVVASPLKMSEPMVAVPEEQSLPQPFGQVEIVDKAEINLRRRLVVLSLTGFLVAGLFLSRAFVMTFFLLGGLAEVVFEMALRQGMVAPRLRLPRVLPFAGGLAIVLVILMYVTVRVLNLTR
jgi:O-Antigen ligase